MKLCSYYHDEVCFEADKCPACEKANLIDEANSEIEDLKRQRDDLATKLFELTNKTP